MANEDIERIINNFGGYGVVSRFSINSVWLDLGWLSFVQPSHIRRFYAKNDSKK